ncbi:hypothetical protein RRJ83_000435 [Vibrio parahaemolyticus]|nr:hypothetical protein [Vibrio parahaemolyticus]
MNKNIGAKLINLLIQHGIEEGARKFQQTDWFDKKDVEIAQSNRRQIQGAFYQYARMLLAFVSEKDNAAFNGLENKEYCDLKRQLDEVEWSFGKQFFDYHIRPTLVIDEELMNMLRGHGVRLGISEYIEENDNYDLEVIITTLDDYARMSARTISEYAELQSMVIDEWNRKGGKFITL